MPEVAAAGTVTVRLDVVAAVTVPATPPEPLKRTVFDAGVVWKFVPVMVMLEPRFPVVGVNDEIVGAETVKLEPEVTLPFEFAT